MRAGYTESPADEEGWRNAPAPLSTTVSDPELDLVAGPTREWAIKTIRSYIDGRLSPDQLYRYSHDLLPYKSEQHESRSQSELESDAVLQFVDALWTLSCICFVVQDDEVPLQHYLPQWLHYLETGEEVWSDLDDQPSADLE